MEQLIEFLLKHWYLVIIAITFLYQLRNKKNQSTQSNRNGTGMPSFGDSQGAPRRAPEARGVPVQGQMPMKQMESAQSVYARSETQRPMDSSMKPKASPFGSSAKASTESSPIYEDDISTSSRFPEQPTQDQLLQGIVWAEILGRQGQKSRTEGNLFILNALLKFQDGRFSHVNFSHKNRSSRIIWKKVWCFPAVMII
ncbi:hypothetical protein [Paenibacillus sp. N3.4]|uniref:hypothetical protein n=1 Tax=Paenibacillus sp. N3.4 TaxID=2603222 RepID=UPI0011C8418D|nr:hypothetical protein [Paenibacillus sp. N3.4]TXK84111.1 hypothetical protein FU659_10765 [Paenibacillus sp. N3.4]